MVKKGATWGILLLAIFSVCLTGIAGCSHPDVDNSGSFVGITNQGAEETPTPTSTLTPTPTSTPTPTPTPKQEDSDFLQLAIKTGTTGISPGKVFIQNIGGGDSAEFVVTLYNGTEDKVEYDVIIKIPDNVDDGYVKFPETLLTSWVSSEVETVTLPPRSEYGVKINMHVQDGYKTGGEKWAAWIAFQAQGQGNVKVQTCTKMLVTFRNDKK